MTEQFRALLAVYIIAFPTLWFARIAFSRIVDKKELTAWLYCWLIVSLSSLLLGNFWLYLIFLFACIIGFSSKTTLAGPKIFFLLLCAVPFFEKDISGFGVIERLMAIGHYKVLALTALLPIVLTGITYQQGKFQIGINRIVIALILLASVLFLRATTLTDSLREAVNMFAVIYLPYFAMSRAITTNQQIRELMVAFLLPMIGISLLGLIETWKWWHLYASLNNIWEINTANYGYKERYGLLRAYVSISEGPIVFGYCLTIAMGFLLAFWGRGVSWAKGLILFVILVVGQISTLSRGPWIGAGIMFLVFVLSSPAGMVKIRKYRALVILLAPLLLVYAFGQGQNGGILQVASGGYENEEAENVDYRRKLIEKSMIVIARYPLFGSVNYRDQLAAMGMLQGEGIVDVVNTYLQFTLENGLVGAALFVSIFLAIVVRLFFTIRALPEEEAELERTGRALLATLVGVLFIIFTVSKVGQIPMLYWSLAGMAVAYDRIARARVVETHAKEQLEIIEPRYDPVSP